MIEYFLSFELVEEEIVMLKAFVNTMANTNDHSMDRVTFEQLMIHDYKADLEREKPDAIQAKKTLGRIRQILQFRRIELVSELDRKYMTPKERQRKWICRRNLKHFFFDRISLDSVEVDNLINFLDKDRDGFIEITAIQSGIDQSFGTK